MYISQGVRVEKGNLRVNSKGRPVDLPRLFPRASAVDGGAGLAMSSAELAMLAHFAARDPAVENPRLAGFGLDANSLDAQSSAPLICRHLGASIVDDQSSAFV